MAKFKVGDKVRVVTHRASVPYGTELTVKRGPIGDVRGGNYHFVESGVVILGDDLEKVKQKQTKSQRIEALEKQVAELKSEIEALKSSEIAGQISKALREEKSKTPNQKRKAIIDEAKAFVEKVTEHIGRHHSREIKGYGRLNDVGNEWILCPYFEVKSEKREVTVVLKTRTNGILQSKGIAKCAPDDVFNADIGKAIALGRALGLDVTRFEQVPQPTELVVGMVVEDIDDDFPIAHGKVAEIEPKDCQGQRGYWTDKRFYAYLTHAKILDDTEAQY